jgi:hypothetical protein
MNTGNCFNASLYSGLIASQAFFDAALQAALTVHESRQKQRDLVHDAVQRAIDGKVLPSLRSIVQSPSLKPFLNAEHIELVRAAITASPNRRRRVCQTASVGDLDA